MSEIKELLFAALKLAKKKEKASRNTAITKEIGAVINKHFKNRRTKAEVVAIIKSSAPAVVTPAEAGAGDLKVWSGPSQSKKTMNVAKASVKAQAAVDEDTASDDNDELELSQITEMTPQKIIDHYGTVDKVRAKAKALGMTIDQDLEAMEFIQEFQEQVLILVMDEDDEPVENPQEGLDPLTPQEEADNAHFEGKLDELKDIPEEVVNPIPPVVPTDDLEAPAE